MADISPIAFIIIGLIVSVVSFFTKLYLFIVVGVCFILWGIFKLLKKPKKKHIIHTNTHCPRCRFQISPHDNFCRHCGWQLKHKRGHPHFQYSSNNQYSNR